ncbi:hypothetical protein IQ249_02490 [Lusitaniella coriacea LEGE 07157]|uniref:Uncharacterized protein n=1 Tax=Lusitaniella coriacea LEGE 07157 TaxID=945747 RepID=A0A8J7DSU1_9CYAN|nr:hypothetical protein [Lusitaniella coriacea]MBE9114757.1 hypothetical protein [Lusitaniella coriacea LEGE 07157]
MKYENMYLIGFRINPENEEPEAYTILLFGETNRPILINDYIVFFSKPEFARFAVESSEPSLMEYLSVPKDVELVVDIAQTLYLINSEDIDLDSTILDFLNIFVDLIQPFDSSMPKSYKTQLSALAAHLTFEREFASFLLQENIERSLITNAVLWLIGKIIAKSQLLMFPEK